MQLCVSHVDVHRVKNVEDPSRIKFVPAVRNLQKNVHVNLKNDVFYNALSDVFRRRILSKIYIKEKWVCSDWLHHTDPST
jgi:hypothetical protein